MTVRGWTLVRAALLVCVAVVLSPLSPALLVFIPAGMGLASLGAVQLMKLANRNAQRRIALGEYPGFDVLGTETKADATGALTDGSAV